MISVIVATRDENVEKSVTAINKTLGEYEHEIIIVGNGSLGCTVVKELAGE